MLLTTLLRRCPARRKVWLMGLLLVVLTALYLRQDNEASRGPSKQGLHGLGLTDLKADPGGEDDLRQAAVRRPVSVGEPPRVILLWTTWRSGSTFLGDLLANAVPDHTFYSFEPLFTYGARVFSQEGNNETYEIIKLLQDLLKCDLHRHSQFVKGLAKLMFPLAANPYYRQKCSRVNQCGNATAFSHYCAMADFHVVKLVRLGLKFASNFLRDPQLADLQIVYLARDPRPVMLSRSQTEHRRWCQPRGGDCADPAAMCKLLEEDLLYVPLLMKEFPDRFTFLRYEDLSLNPPFVVRKLWEKLQLPLTDSFLDYLNKTTSGRRPKEQRLDSTRDTYQHTFIWRSDISWDLLQAVQESCLEVIPKLGWRLFSSESDLRNVSIPVTAEEAASDTRLWLHGMNGPSAARAAHQVTGVRELAIKFSIFVVAVAGVTMAVLIVLFVSLKKL